VGRSDEVGNCVNGMELRVLDSDGVIGVLSDMSEAVSVTVMC